MADGVINKIHGLQLKIVTTSLSVGERSVAGNSGFSAYMNIPNQDGYKFLMNIGICGQGVPGLYAVLDAPTRYTTQTGWYYIYNFSPTTVNTNNLIVNVISLFVKEN